MRRVFFPGKQDFSRRGGDAIDNDQTQMTSAFLFLFLSRARTLAPLLSHFLSLCIVTSYTLSLILR